MLLRIEVKTIKGCALDTAHKLKPFIIGHRQVKNKIWANATDDTIYWEVEAEARVGMHIARNLGIFDKLANGILGNKLVQGAAKVSPEAMKQLKEMLHNQTSIRVVKMEEPFNLEEFVEQAGN
jgi:phage major head subunit gpT-like protein